MAYNTFDKHHILPRSRGGSNSRDNIVRLDVRHHKALHMLFINNTVPEQIDRILGIASTALTEEVKSDIIKILDIDDMQYWYKKGIFKNNHS